MNTIYGYWRCSTDAQDQERQIRSLKDAGCEVIVGDKITGTSDYGDRQELAKLLEAGVRIKTLDNRLDSTTMNAEIIKLIVSVMGYAAEMELKNIKRRTAEGRAVALSRGVKFGMKRKYDTFQIGEIMKKRSQGEGYGTIGKAMGMSRSTVATIVKRELASIGS